ncbi:MAG: trigger factor [Gemmatimonadota bacterium]|nr:MAG: trigger factor [Gemmatimonadota bacterium]
MKVAVSEPKAGQKLLEIEVPIERVEGALKAAYEDYRKKARLPGFRKGKAPLDIIKSRFGRAIESEVIDDLISETYNDAQSKEGIRPAGAAKVESVEYESGKPLRYKATVEVMPDITLKEYRGIEVTKEIPNITDEDVDAALESLRDQYAEVVGVDDEAQEGHFVVADIQAVDRGHVPIVGDKVENADFQLGKSPFGPEFDKELVGMKRCEDRVVKITYPKDHHDPKVAGSEHFFSVKMKEVKEKKLPELNDDLAKTVGGMNTLEDLRRRVEEELVRRAEFEAERNVRDQISDRLVKDNPVTVPEGMVNRFLDSFIADIREKSREPFDEEVLRNRYRPFAMNQIRLHLILEEIGQHERIEGGEEKIMNYLIEKAEISEVEPVRKEGASSLIVQPPTSKEKL